MLYSKLVEELAQEVGLTQVRSKLAVQRFFELVAKHLEEGENIMIPRFGTFQAHVKRHKIFNRKLGTMVEIEPRMSVKFIPSVRLKEQLNGEYTPRKRSKKQA